MSRRISFISLIKEPSVFVQHAQNRIIGSLAGVYPETGGFETFTDTKEMLKCLSASFTRSKVVVVCADTSRFPNLKKILFQAMSLETEPSDGINAALQIVGGDISAETALSHSLVPKDAAVFVSEDGLFSGFAVQSGKQHLVVLPLDLERLDLIIENGFAAYIKSALHTAEMPAESTSQTDGAANAVEKLIAEGFCAAIAATKSADFIKMNLTPVSGWEKSFKFAVCDEDKKKLTQKEYIANLALQARESTGCPVGAAISNVFTSEKEDNALFVLVTVADSLRARVAKVYAQPGESPRQLVVAAVDTLFAMLSEYTDAGGFTGFPLQVDEPEMPGEERKGKTRLALKLIISGIAALVLCLIIIFFGGHMVKAVKDFSGKFINADETQIVTANPATEVTSAGIGGESDTDDLLSILAQMPSYASDEESTAQTESIAVSSISQSTSGTTAKAQTSSIKTTAASTTKAPATTTTTVAAITDPTPSSGTFTFAVKGYGHGVGMSQKGAIAYANQGWSYDAILLHYYQPGVTIIDDTSPPASVNYDGKSYPLLEYLARAIAQEIGAGSPIESLKAQAVAAYTYAKVYSFSVTSTQSAFSASFNMDPNSNVVKAAEAVAGKYLSYDSKPIKAFYFASCAGQTVSSVSVWSGTAIPYLGGGVSSPETIAISNKSITSNDFRTLVNNYNAACNPANVITLQSNPAEWLQIISTDSAGYVNKIRVGNKEMSGNTFRYSLLKLSIKSHCFTVVYE